jgi:hypothetical protein
VEELVVTEHVWHWIRPLHDQRQQSEGSKFAPRSWSAPVSRTQKRARSLAARSGPSRAGCGTRSCARSPRAKELFPVTSGPSRRCAARFSP